LLNSSLRSCWRWLHREAGLLFCDDGEKVERRCAFQRKKLVRAWWRRRTKANEENSGVSTTLLYTDGKRRSIAIASIVTHAFGLLLKRTVVSVLLYYTLMGSGRQSLLPQSVTHALFGLLLKRTVVSVLLYYILMGKRTSSTHLPLVTQALIPRRDGLRQGQDVVPEGAVARRGCAHSEAQGKTGVPRRSRRRSTYCTYLLSAQSAADPPLRRFGLSCPRLAAVGCHRFLRPYRDCCRWTNTERHGRGARTSAS